MTGPIFLNSDLRQRFIEEVENEEVGMLLFEFYRQYLNFGGAKTFDEKKKKILNLNDRRIAHLKSILKEHDLMHIVECAEIIIKRMDEGKIKTDSVRPGYFDKILLNKIQ